MSHALALGPARPPARRCLCRGGCNKRVKWGDVVFKERAQAQVQTAIDEILHSAVLGKRVEFEDSGKLLQNIIVAMPLPPLLWTACDRRLEQLGCKQLGVGRVLHGHFVSFQGFPQELLKLGSERLPPIQLTQKRDGHKHEWLRRRRQESLRANRH